MKRFFFVCASLCILLTILLCGCGEEQPDRGEELRAAMKSSDSTLSQAFPEGTAASFSQIADFIAGWGGSTGLDVTKIEDHYVVLTNPATKGQKKTPTVTTVVAMNPDDINAGVSQLSLGMSSVLGPADHGRLRLIVTEASDNVYPGAEEVSGKYLDCDHLICLYGGGSASVYTAGPMSAKGTLTCSAGRKKPSYDNAFTIRLSIPDRLDPYVFEKEDSLPNPINVLGDLLASAKSSGRLFEIASFTAKENGNLLPSEAKAVVVVDDNNVEAFRKRFDKSYEAFEKRFGELENETDENGEPLLTFSYTMEETKMPGKVLKQSASDNIISLMYTLQTGIHIQDEESSSINAASYIRSVSTSKGRLSLVMDMRSRDDTSMEEMSGNYLITSGLCDVKYDSSKPHRLWSAAKDSSLAAWFIASVNKKGAETIRLQSSECDTLYPRGNKPDMIAYRFDKDKRGDALDNLLAYYDSLSVQD